MANATILVRPDLVMSLAHDLEALERGDRDLAGVLADAPVIDGWRYLPYVTACLGGGVSGHPLLGDRPSIATSMLFALNPEGGWARTLSRWYRVGRRAGARTDG